MFWVIALIMGTVCAIVANSKGRSAVGWFFIGFLFGLIALIIVAVMPNLKEQQSKEKAQKRENRRLKEMLRQEQLKNESFRKHAIERLDKHDEVLEISTKHTTAIEQKESAPEIQEEESPQIIEQSESAPYEEAEQTLEQEPLIESVASEEASSDRFIMASCSNGHEFEVNKVFVGTTKVCPSCYESVRIKA